MSRIIHRRSKRMETRSAAWQRLFIWRMRRLREPLSDLLHNIDTFDTFKWPPETLAEDERHGYEPTPWSALPKIFKHVHLDFSRFTFIDMGSGKGRVVLTASKLPFQSVIGVEFLPELCRIAENNLKTCRFLRRRTHDIKIIECDAIDFVPPNTPCMFFFLNPFGERLMQLVVNNIVGSYLKSPRDLYMICIGGGKPTDFAEIARNPALKLQQSFVIPWGLLTRRNVAVFSVTAA